MKCWICSPDAEPRRHTGLIWVSRWLALTLAERTVQGGGFGHLLDAVRSSGKYQRAAGKRVCQRYPEDAAFRTLFPVPVWPTLSGIQLEFLTGEWRKKKTQIKKHIMPHAEADGESIGCMEIPQIPHLSWKSSISRVSILPTFRFCSEENKSQSLKDHSPPQPPF